MNASIMLETRLLALDEVEQLVELQHVGGDTDDDEYERQKASIRRRKAQLQTAQRNLMVSVQRDTGTGGQWGDSVQPDGEPVQQLPEPEQSGGSEDRR